jgi:L-alanine-DL-glutamate epimerase-like enolase superfamily enzyme
MRLSRRQYLRTGLAGGAGSILATTGCASPEEQCNGPRYVALDQTLHQPVLKRELFPDPVIIDRLELLRFGDNFLCRVNSKDGAEGLSISNNAQMRALYPIFTQRLQPFFPGKDARDWEQLLEEVYVYESNYKLQNLALWVPRATIEFAVLDMLGKIAGKPMGALIGDVIHPEIAVYRANNHRGKTASASLELIRENVEATGAKALKFKVGGRMSHNADFPPDRSEKLIPMVRHAFGEDMVIYADSNGSYDTQEAIRIGRIMEAYNYDFFEEPVPFDWYEETREVTQTLSVPVAGGEQEPSMHTFRWLVANGALDVVQPDIFYFGGMIRSMKVARMAATRGIPCTPHISGSGLGYLYMMHFVSAVPNAGPFHEFKGFNREIPMECPTAPLTSEDGVIRVPTGPGLGVNLDPSFIQRHSPV